MTDAAAPLYQLSNVRRQYGPTLAVDVEGLSVDRRETLCLLGPTGAGKSTLLRLLAALEPPTSGSIELEGETLLAGRTPLERQRRLTMVFQRPVLLAGTVEWNVAYGLRLRHGRQFPAEKVRRVLERLGLARLARQSAKTLSGGQTQLVALARGLVLEPDVLLLDEPTSHLDPAHVALVEQFVQEQRSARPTTIVWATHNLFQARRVATRVALLLEGRLVEVAATDEFFQTPNDPRTRDFVAGKMIY